MDPEVRQMAESRVLGTEWEQIAARLGGTADARRKQFSRAIDDIATNTRDRPMTTASAETPVHDAMRELRRFPRDQWLDLAPRRPVAPLAAGRRADAEAYFQHLPELRDDSEEALVLINGEVVLRREIGQSPAVAEYQRRFPELADGIALQFSIHDILGPANDVQADQAARGVGDLELPGYVFLAEIARGAIGRRLQGTTGIARAVRRDQGHLPRRRRPAPARAAPAGSRAPSRSRSTPTSCTSTRSASTAGTSTW